MSHRRRSGLLEDSRARLEFSELLELVAGYATSPAGRAAVLALDPCADEAETSDALLDTEEARTLLRTRFSPGLEHLKDIAAFLPEVGAPLTRALLPEELAAIRELLDRFQILRSTLETRSDATRTAQRLAPLEDAVALRELLLRSVDPQGQILDDASPELAETRTRIEEKERWLRRWMERHRDQAPWRSVLQGNVVSVRNGRFVYAVRAEQRHRVEGVVHAESTTGATIFIEPQGVVLHGNDLEELRGRERREIARILAELTKRVLAERGTILPIHRALAELDSVFAKARYAETFAAVAPRVERTRLLRLEHARHPLLLARERELLRGAALGAAPPPIELVLARVQPLTIELDASKFQRVITGPNTGGKTIAIKCVGLLALMAACGIPIPAGGDCRMPVFDGIYADIGDEQSIEQSLSTFSSHMSVIAEILRVASSRSLVLIDELGGGTDPLEGAALGEAILESLYRRGAFLLVTTHIGKLKEFAYRNRKCGNASMEFDLERLVPTYRLVEGVPGRSSATHIARRLGLPEEVVARAEELEHREARVDEKVIAGMERTRRDLERRKSEMERHRDVAERTGRAVEEELERVRATRSAVDYEAERAEEERVLRLTRLLRDRIRALGDLPKERQGAVAELLAAIAEAERGTRLAERRLARGRELRKGDWVFVPRYKQVLEVRKVSKQKELLTVAFAGGSAEVPFGEISWVLPPPGFDVSWYSEPEDRDPA